MRTSDLWPEQLLLDGALGTQLEARGLNLQDSLWSARAVLDAPAAIQEVHLEYLEAGARCLTTASYQISFEGFLAAGRSRDDAEAALSKSVQIAQAARKEFQARRQTAEKILIAASVGSYGAAQADGSEFHGNFRCSQRELVEFHAGRLRVLGSAKPDLFACETLPSLAEAQAIADALRTSQIPAWFSFTCGDDAHTAHGEPIRDCARALEKIPAAVAVGVNCTAPHLISPLIRNIRLETQKPIVVYPNAGQKWDAATKSWIGQRSGADLSEMAVEWIRLGANWIGGCCGFGPEDIRRVHQRISAA